jgi:hypothetical protein
MVIAAGVPAVAALLCAVLPAHSLHLLAGQFGHADDIVPERIARFRIVATSLTLAHLLLVTYLTTIGRVASRQFVARICSEACSIRPTMALRTTARCVARPGWLHSIILLVVFGVAFLIRLGYLQIPMDYDESYSFLNYARRPVYQGLADYNSTNNHLLNTLCMHIGFRSFGPVEWSLRLGVFFAGLAAVGTVYILGRCMLGADVGLLAAATAATSYVMVNYSVNARGYIWTAWMTSLLMLAFWRIARSNEPLAVDWLGATAAAVLGMFALPTMLYAIAGCIGWLMMVPWLKGGQATERLSPQAAPVDAVANGGREAPGAPHSQASGGREPPGLLEVPQNRWPQADHSPWTRLVGIGIWALLVALIVLWLYAPALVHQGTQAWQHPFVRSLAVGTWFSRVPAAALWSLRSWAEGPVPWYAAAVFGVVGLHGVGMMNRHAFLLFVSVLLATFMLMALQRVAPPPRVLSFLAPLFYLCAASGVVSLAKLAALSARGTEARQWQASGTVSVLCSWIACGICAWGYFASRQQPLPGGPRPAFLVEDVQAERSRGLLATRSGPTQLWRLDVKEAVVNVQIESNPDDRVLVGLPADLPFRFYAAQRDWAPQIGGEPQPTERLFLVIRSGERPGTALQQNLSLQLNYPWLVQAPWRLVVAGELAVWLAEPDAPRSTPSVDP